MALCRSSDLSLFEPSAFVRRTEFFLNSLIDQSAAFVVFADPTFAQSLRFLSYLCTSPRSILNFCGSIAVGSGGFTAWLGFDSFFGAEDVLR